jgi:RNA polymerase sigma-70 factor (ECF subfamily)
LPIPSDRFSDLDRDRVPILRLVAASFVPAALAEEVTMSDLETQDTVDALRQRLAASDEAAFEAVFDRFAAPVFRFVSGMVGDDALAHDLVQETFASLWKARERLAGVDSLPAYLFQVARNCVYSNRRSEKTRRARRAEYGRRRPASPGPAPDDDLDAQELRAKMREWIEALPERQREALVLAREDDLSHDEIARVMDISPNTVNNHIVKAMERLRERLRDHRPDLL